MLCKPKLARRFTNLFDCNKTDVLETGKCVLVGNFDGKLCDRLHSKFVDRLLTSEKVRSEVSEKFSIITSCEYRMSIVR